MDCFVSDGASPIKLNAYAMDSVNSSLLDNNFVVEKKPEVEVFQLPPQVKMFKPEEIISTNAVVPYAFSPSQFWIQLDPDEVDLIMEKVTDVTTHPDDLPALDMLIPGSPCLALFPTDNSWYRAVINAVYGERVEVTYIDYGNNGSVEANKLKRLPDSLRQWPGFALECSLKGAEDLVGVEKVFQSLVLDLTYTVTFVELEDGRVHVRLYDTDGNDLVETLRRDSTTETDQLNATNEVDTGKNQLDLGEKSSVPDEKRSEPVEIHSDIVENQHVTTQSQLDIEDSQPDMAESRSHSVGNQPQLEEKQLAVDPNQPKLVVVEPSNSPMGQKFFISVMESPSRFWIQLEANMEYIYDIQDGIASLKFSKVVNATVGDIYLVRHADYDDWFRAQLKSLSKGSAHVYFIDYGGFLLVDMVDICECPKVFKRIPWLAIECSMNASLLDVCTAEKVQILKVQTISELFSSKDVKYASL